MPPRGPRKVVGVVDAVRNAEDCPRARDLAQVGCRHLGDEAGRKSSALGLTRAVPFLRRQIGKRLRLPLTDRLIPIIADDFVDREFGSGCVKITPAHDFNDFEVGSRHPEMGPPINGIRMPRVRAELIELYLRLPLAWKIFGRQMFVAARKI